MGGHLDDCSARTFFPGSFGPKRLFSSLSLIPLRTGRTTKRCAMIVKPDLWGNTIRLRFSNTWGTRPVTLGRVSGRVCRLIRAIYCRELIPPLVFAGQPSVTLRWARKSLVIRCFSVGSIWMMMAGMASTCWSTAIILPSSIFCPRPEWADYLSFHCLGGIFF